MEIRVLLELVCIAEILQGENAKDAPSLIPAKYLISPNRRDPQQDVLNQHVSLRELFPFPFYFAGKMS